MTKKGGLMSNLRYMFVAMLTIASVRAVDLTIDYNTCFDRTIKTFDAANVEVARWNLVADSGRIVCNVPENATTIDFELNAKRGKEREHAKFKVEILTSSFGHQFYLNCGNKRSPISSVEESGVI